MNRFRYKLSVAVKVGIITLILAWAFGAIVSVIRLFNQNKYAGSVAADVTIIVMAVVFIVVLFMVYFMRYKIDKTGIKLMIGFVPLLKKQLSFDNVKAIIYSVKQQKLFVSNNIDTDTPTGTAINISPAEFNAFVQCIRQQNVPYDYIEDIG